MSLSFFWLLLLDSAESSQTSVDLSNCARSHASAQKQEATDSQRALFQIETLE
jgi:hypothetical protein